MKKALCLLMSLVMVVAMLTACGSSSDKKVGVSMPTKDLQRWNQDGDNMVKQLKEKGYDVEIQ
ncbi:MAG: ABC transporter substrate-binding protein, partial [Lachnospiraceae bacterium]|nr:ABC transporter substrate-binding protein [Lachnospiraceae bacterium]MCR5829994.1 ABC transporter substrate-binding protein [Lachnospiraceae bacterium]